MEKVIVAVRVRPLNYREHSHGEKCMWTIDPLQNTISISAPALCDLIESKTLSPSASVSCGFDCCMSETTSNREVYQDMIQPVLESFLDGVNGTVMVYGPTGAGKTYTMLGNDERREKLRGTGNADSSFFDETTDNGALLYAMENIFTNVSMGTEAACTNILKCSYIEIYNDSIFDLLQEKSRIHTPLSINELDSKEFVVKDAIEHTVSNIHDFLEVVKKGERNRHYAESVMNHNSSRSHTIFKIKLIRISQADGTITKSEINFVDLAGSEKCANSEANFTEEKLKGWQLDELQSKNKERLKEGQYINKSLFFLTQVISKKSDETVQHVPYRNTPLTKILKSSLGGNNKTCIILCVSPARSQFEHSLQTLKFGLNARKIENKTRKNVIANNSEETLKLLIQEYHSRLASIGTAQGGDGKYSQSEYDELKAENKMLLEQLQSNNDPKSPLLVLSINDKEDVNMTFSEERKDILETEIIKKCIEAIKLKSKQAFLCQKQSQRLEELNKKLTEHVSSQSTLLTKLQNVILEKDAYVSKLKEVVQDHLKILKAQAAKLEVYESAEKWLPGLSSTELSNLASHLKGIIEKIQPADDTGKVKSGVVKLLPGTMVYMLIAKLSATNKIAINTKHDEPYINSLLSKECASFSEPIPEPPLMEKGEGSEEEYDQETQKCLKQIKELLQRSRSPPKYRREASTKTLERDKPTTKSNITIPDISNIPPNVVEQKTKAASPTMKIASPARLTFARPKPRNAKSALNSAARTPVSRSTSSCSKNQVPQSRTKSGLDLLQKIEAQKKQRKERTPTPGKKTVMSPTVRKPPIPRGEGNSAKKPLIEPVKTVKKKPPQVVEIEWEENKIDIDETHPEDDMEMLLTKSVMEMTKSIKTENNKTDLKALQNIVNQMYMK